MPATVERAAQPASPCVRAAAEPILSRGGAGQGRASCSQELRLLRRGLLWLLGLFTSGLAGRAVQRRLRYGGRPIGCRFLNLLIFASSSPALRPCMAHQPGGIDPGAPGRCSSSSACRAVERFLVAIFTTPRDWCASKGALPGPSGAATSAAYEVANPGLAALLAAASGRLHSLRGRDIALSLASGWPALPATTKRCGRPPDDRGGAGRPAGAVSTRPPSGLPSFRPVAVTLVALSGVPGTAQARGDWPRRCAPCASWSRCGP